MSFKIKKDVIPLLIISTLSLLLLNQLFRYGVFYSHDGELHIARLAQLSKELIAGQIPVRWLPNWNFGFGYPTFVYIYSLPYYVGFIFKIFPLTFEQIFKVLLFLSLFTSGVTFYYFARSKFSRLSSTIGAIFYISAPYRFADIYERGALGEALVFIFLPLLFLMPSVLKRNLLKGFVANSLVIFAAITTHALTFLIFFPVSLIYAVFVLPKKIKYYFAFLGSVVLGFLLASFQWIPMIFEQKYINLAKTYYNLYLGHLITVNQLLRIPKAGVNTGTGIQLGVAQLFIVLLSIALTFYKLLRKRKNNIYSLYFIITCLFAAFLATDLSRGIWQSQNFLHPILFPWRFLTLSIFSAASLGAFIADEFKSQKLLLIPVIVFIAVFPSRHYLKGTNLHSESDSYYLNYQDKDKLDNYYLPTNLTIDLSKLKVPQASLIGGNGTVVAFKRQNTKISFQADLEKDSKIQLHAIYFPGWELYVNGRSQKIITNYPGLEGIIVAAVPRGKNEIILKFSETPLRKLSDIISVFAFILFVVFLIKYYFLQVSKKVKQAL